MLIRKNVLKELIKGICINLIIPLAEFAIVQCKRKSKELPN